MITFYHMVHKKEEGTYHRIEKLMKEVPGISKDQRIPDRSKMAHRKPPVKCFLTIYVRKYCIYQYPSHIPQISV